MYPAERETRPTIIVARLVPHANHSASFVIAMSKSIFLDLTLVVDSIASLLCGYQVGSLRYLLKACGVY